MSLFDNPQRELLPYDGSAMYYDWVLEDLDASVLFSELLKNMPYEYWAKELGSPPQ